MVPHLWQAPGVAVSVGNAVLFCVFVQVLFDEEFALRPVPELLLRSGTVVLVVMAVCILKSSALHPAVLQWLDQYIPEGIRGSASEETRIDSAEEGAPPRTVKHRCALVVNPKGEGLITTGYGLAFLWLVFVCANFVPPVRPTT